MHALLTHNDAMPPTATDLVQTHAPTVVLAGGGTGGHVVPALALADAFRAVGAQVVFIGTAQGYEATMVPKRGHRLMLVAGSRLVGGGVLTKLRGITNLAKGIWAARQILQAERPALVIGVGGYASGATLLAARSLGIATAVHESNAVPGLTNKVLGRMVGRVYVGFAAATPSFPQAATRLTGNPVRSEIAAVGPVRQARPQDRKARVLVLGGSQGSQFLNSEVPGLVQRAQALGADVEVRHQVGKLPGDPVQAAYAELGIPASVLPFIDDMAGAYAWADVAITRAGSGTVAELAAAALPALLVPFPHAAGDHQAANAQAFCHGGAGRWTRQAAWQADELAPWLAELTFGGAVWQAASAAARAFALPNAAKAVVHDCGQWLHVAAWSEVSP